MRWSSVQPGVFLEEKVGLFGLGKKREWNKKRTFPREQILAFVFLQVLMVFFSCGQSTFISVYFPAYIVSIYWERSLKVAKTLHKDHVREGKRVNTGQMPFSSSFVNGDVGEQLPLGNERLGEKAELFLNGEGGRA